MLRTYNPTETVEFSFVTGNNSNLFWFMFQWKMIFMWSQQITQWNKCWDFLILWEKYITIIFMHIEDFSSKDRKKLETNLTSFEWLWIVYNFLTTKPSSLVISSYQKLLLLKVWMILRIIISFCWYIICWIKHNTVWISSPPTKRLILP